VFVGSLIFYGVKNEENFVSYAYLFTVFRSFLRQQ
jgi:hypothetical protein